MSGTFEMVYVPSICQSNALLAASDPECNRDTMASLYADCIIADKQGQLREVDFKKINEAITARWPKGLLYIKKMAWRRISRGQSS